MQKEVRAIWDNISSGNLKQAQIKLGKELKKYPRNAYLLSVQAYVLMKEGKKDQALEQARHIASYAVPTASTLNLIVEVFFKYGLWEEMLTMFESASRKEPTNVEVIEAWLDAMITANSTKGIQKSFMALQKATGERSHKFGVVLAMYLSFVDPTTRKEEKALFPMLGGRIVEQLKPFTSPQEVYVYALTLKMASSEKLAEYLRSEEATKWDSLDLEVMMIEALEQSSNWQGLLEECEKKVGKLHANYIYWDGFVKANVKLGRATEAAQILKSSVSKETKRNAAVATMKLAELTNGDLLQAVTLYFEQFGHKRVAFVDLQPYITKLDRQQLIDWLTSVETTKGFDSLDALDWVVNISKLKHQLGVEEDTLKLFRKTEHLINGKDPKDYFSGCDLLCIQASKHIYKGEFHLAATLLEYAAKIDFHNFYVRTMLIRVYILLGSFKSAYVHYNELKIKTTQEETLSYMLSTRVSTLDPSNGAKLASHCLTFFNETQAVAPLIKQAFGKQAFTQVEGFIDLNKRLGSSLNKRLLELEGVRSERLCAKNDPSTAALESEIVDLYDNRDFDSLWKMPSVGPVQSQLYARAFQLREQVVRRLVSGEDLEQRAELLLKATEEAAGELTAAEKWSLSSVYKLAQLALNKNHKSPHTDIFTGLEVPETIDWNYFHVMFTQMELCRIVKGYVQRLQGPKNQDGLLKEATSLAEQLKSAAKDIKDKRSSRTLRLVEELTQFAEDSVRESSFVESIVERIQSSYETQLTVLRNVAV